MEGKYSFTSPEWADISGKLNFFPAQLRTDFINWLPFFLIFAEDPKDLIRKCLVVEPEKRITVKEALAHPFFTTTVSFNIWLHSENRTWAIRIVVNLFFLFRTQSKFFHIFAFLFNISSILLFLYLFLLISINFTIFFLRKKNHHSIYTKMHYEILCTQYSNTTLKLHRTETNNKKKLQTIKTCNSPILQWPKKCSYLNKILVRSNAAYQRKQDDSVAYPKLHW